MGPDKDVRPRACSPSAHVPMLDTLSFAQLHTVHMSLALEYSSSEPACIATPGRQHDPLDERLMSMMRFGIILYDDLTPRFG